MMNHRSKNRQMMIAIIILIIVTTTGIMACGQGKKKPVNAANESSIWTDTKIPEEFKDYKVLNSNYENDNYETILFAKSNDYMAPSPIRVSWSVNDQVILSVCRSQEEPEPGYHHYKLNKSGEVLDSLYVPFKGGGLIGLYGPYAVHVSYKEDYYYTTWPLNGDLKQKKIEILNGDLSWSAEKLEKTYLEIVRNGEYTFNQPVSQPGDGEPDWSLQRIFFVENGRYKVLYKKMKQYAKAPEFKGMATLSDEFYYTSDDQNPKFAQNFKLKYFQQVEKLSYDHSIGGGSPSYSTTGWAGRVFFDLPINKGILKLRYDGIIKETGTSGDNKTRYYRSHGEGASVSPFNLNLYTSSRLDFAVYSTSSRYIYLIKPKKSLESMRGIHP